MTYVLLLFVIILLIGGQFSLKKDDDRWTFQLIIPWLNWEDPSSKKEDPIEQKETTEDSTTAE